MTIIFPLSSISKKYEITANDEYLCFGNLLEEKECFFIPLQELVIFFKVLKELRFNFEKNSDRKTKIFETPIKDSFYFSKIPSASDQSLQKTMFSLIIENSISKEKTYELSFSYKSFIEFLRCFRYFSFSSLPISSNIKLWFKHCANLKNFQTNDLNLSLLYKEAKLAIIMFNIKNCDVFDLVELSLYYQSLIIMNSKVSKMINSPDLPKQLLGQI